MAGYNDSQGNKVYEYGAFDAANPQFHLRQQQEALARQAQAQRDQAAAQAQREQAARYTQQQDAQTAMIRQHYNANANRPQRPAARVPSRTGRFFLVVIALLVGYSLVPHYIYLYGTRFPFFLTLVAIVFVLSRLRNRSWR